MSAVALDARRSDRFEAKLAHTVALLAAAAAGHGTHVVQATSLGAEDMVVTDLIARHRLAIAVSTLDTGRRGGIALRESQRRPCHVREHRLAQGLLRPAQARAAGPHAGRRERLDHRLAP